MQFLTERQVTITVTANMINKFNIFFFFFGSGVNNLQSFILVGTGSKTFIATGTEAANLFSVKVDAWIVHNFENFFVTRRQYFLFTF